MNFLFMLIPCSRNRVKIYIRRKCGELYYGVRNDLKDWAQKLFVVVFNIFNKCCKKRGNKILFCSGSRAEIWWK